MSIRGKLDESLLEDGLAVRKLLGLDPKAQDFDIV